MSDVYAGLIFYNDGPVLFEECLKALIVAGVKPVCIDGAYQDFPRKDGEEFHSTDGCLDVARKYAHVLVESPKDGWPTQVHKRNKYMETIPVDSYVMYIDADEVLRPPPKPISSMLSSDVHRVNVKIWDSPTSTKQWTEVRIYKNHPDLRYKYQHCRLYHLDRHVEGELDSGIVSKAHGAILLTYPAVPLFYDHYRYRRPQDRIDRKMHFYKVREESKFGYD